MNRNNCSFNHCKVPTAVCHVSQQRPIDSWRWIVAIPNVASHPPVIAGFPLVERDIFSRILHGWVSRFGMKADCVCAPLERPLAQNPHLIHKEC